MPPPGSGVLVHDVHRQHEHLTLEGSAGIFIPALPMLAH
jgi:hypothetical protein